MSGLARRSRLPHYSPTPIPMTLKKVLLALAALICLMHAPTAAAQALSQGEQLTLCTYTGQALGRSITDSLKLKSLGVVTNTSPPCASLASVIGAGMLTPGPHEHTLSVTALGTDDDVRPIVESFRENDAIALVFGGKASAEDTYALTRSLLSELARRHYTGVLFFNPRVWRPRLLARVADDDPVVAAYLAAKSNMYAASIDVSRGKARLHQVHVRDGEQTLSRTVDTIAMHKAWLALAKRSM